MFTPSNPPTDSKTILKKGLNTYKRLSSKDELHKLRVTGTNGKHRGKQVRVSGAFMC